MRRVPGAGRVFPRLRLALFAGQFALLDVVTRGPLAYARRPLALVSLAASLALGALLARLATRRTSRVGVALVLAGTLVLDGLVRRYYGTWLDDQVVASALHGWADVRPIVLRLLPMASGLSLLVALAELVLLTATGPRRATSPAVVGASCALVVATLSFLPDAALTPELRAFHALVALPRLASAERRATPGTLAVEVTPLPSTATDVPSVMLVVTESVGASSYCVGHEPGCVLSPEVDALFPDRVPLRQMRALASYTALSVGVLMTGRPLLGPGGQEERLDAAPTLFDLARATRVGEKGLFVAYWSGQAASVLPRELRSSVDSWVTLETLLGHGVDDEDDAVEQDMDGRLARRCVAELDGVYGPSFIVLHLLGTHAPYYTDDAHSPFQPMSRVVTWTGLPALANAYRDAVVTQDHALAACLRAFVDRQGHAPWMVIFTSDHGEAFGEHGAIHHGQNLYDEQIHVPGWVALSPTGFTAERHANLAAHEDAFVTHLDVLPTVLDALGVEGALGLAPFRSHFPGSSLLAPVVRSSPIAMTNCTSRFPCPLSTWGMLGDGRALVAQPWDSAFRCVDLRAGLDPERGASCRELRAASREYFATLPGGQSNVE